MKGDKKFIFHVVAFYHDGGFYVFICFSHSINVIIEIELQKLYGRIKNLGYTLLLSDTAKSFIADKGFDKQFGARPLKRAIQKYVEDALAEEIITSKITVGDEIFMDIAEGAEELNVTIQKAEEPTK